MIAGGNQEYNEDNEKDFMVKIYLNDDIEEHYSAQGILDGENIVFDQKLKIRDIVGLNNLRFELVDTYGKVHGHGIFDLNRLASNSKRATFMVSFLPASNQPPDRTIVSSYSNLSPVYLQNNTPVHRTLRIEAVLIEKMEIIQMFLKIKDVSVPYTSIRYRIPFTK